VEDERAGDELEPHGGQETILVVEDEEMIRNLARQTLEEKGYSVMTAASGAEALSLCRDFQGHLALVLTDVVMPLISGTELAQRIAFLQPQAKFVYMSGYTEDSIVRRGVLEHQVHFLQKPFSPASLANKVREVLDERPN